MLGIIIPHYNNITGLEQALNSLTTQTKKTFVVTVVDDCSTIEGVDEVIEKFSDRLHINLIKLPENKGVGNARQVGMDSINEQFFDYISFIDSDDIVLPQYVEILYSTARANGAVMIRSNFIAEGKGINTVCKNDLTWLHGKTFNLKFIRDNNITFPRIRYNEDAFFLTLIRNLADEGKIGSIDSTTYIWRNNENSLTRNSPEYVNHICKYYFIECMTKAFIDLAKQKKIKKSHFCSTLLNLYAYYQHCLLVQNEKYPIEALDKLLSELFSLPLIKEIMNKTPNSGTTLCSTKINKKVVYFKESYGAWLSKYMEASND